MPRILELVDLYNDLDNAVFFDGKITNEFVNIGKYTPDQWKEKANQFLKDYQQVLRRNTTIAKYDYLLRASEYETQLAYFGDSISRTTHKSHNTLQNNLVNDRPDEPFDGYFDLIRKMATPIDVLEKVLKETSDSSMTQDLPTTARNVETIGDFTFAMKQQKVVSVHYKEEPVSLTPKVAKTFLCIMRKCYGNTKTISIAEINDFNNSQTDDEKYVRTMVSKINRVLKDLFGSNNPFITSSDTDVPGLFEINHDFMSKG